MYGYVYKCTVKNNNKIYIGIHRKSEFDEYYWGSGVVWQKALLKYDTQNIERSILEECDDEETLVSREVFWIAKFDSTNPNIRNIV